MLLAEKQAIAMIADLDLPLKVRKQTVKEEFKDFLEREQAWDSEESFTTGDGESSAADESESENEYAKPVQRKAVPCSKRSTYGGEWLRIELCTCGLLYLTNETKVTSVTKVETVQLPQNPTMTVCLKVSTIPGCTGSVLSSN